MFDIVVHARPEVALTNAMEGVRVIKMSTDGVSMEGNEDDVLKAFRGNLKIHKFDNVFEEFFHV